MTCPVGQAGVLWGASVRRSHRPPSALQGFYALRLFNLEGKRAAARQRTSIPTVRRFFIPTTSVTTISASKKLIWCGCQTRECCLLSITLLPDESPRSSPRLVRLSTREAANIPASRRGNLLQVYVRCSHRHADKPKTCGAARPRVVCRFGAAGRDQSPRRGEVGLAARPDSLSPESERAAHEGTAPYLMTPEHTQVNTLHARSSRLPSDRPLTATVRGG
jgi:hypothetical protein